MDFLNYLLEITSVENMPVIMSVIIVIGLTIGQPTFVDIP
jgi:hypothetical protein